MSIAYILFMLVGLSCQKIKLLQNQMEDIKADNRFKLQNDPGWSGRLWLIKEQFYDFNVSLVPLTDDWWP